LDVVPLNYTTEFILNIFNDGYSNSNITANIIQDYTQLPLKLKFLNGSTIGASNPKLKVEITF